MSTLRVHEVADGAAWEAVRTIRQRVFVDEQGCPPEEEWDAHDWPEDQGRTCCHLLGEEDGRPVAASRWRPVRSASGTEWAKLERFAVLPEARGHGHGRAMVEATMASARATGHDRLMLSAQTYLEDFYAGWGFRPRGEVFWEAGIPHVKMTLED
ncbi:MAG: GNAT family N-acetyltransferase [Bacteroidota bacterium]